MVFNWEINKSYSDINKLKLLSNVFDVSLDEFVKGNIEKMKKGISEYDIRKYNSLDIIFTIEFIVMLISAYPLLKFLEIFDKVKKVLKDLDNKIDKLVFLFHNIEEFK